MGCVYPGVPTFSSNVTGRIRCKLSTRHAIRPGEAQASSHSHLPTILWSQYSKAVLAPPQTVKLSRGFRLGNFLRYLEAAKRHEIGGWAALDALVLVAEISRFQHHHLHVFGKVAEIGIHHGTSLVCFVVVGGDPFAERQALLCIRALLLGLSTVSPRI